MPRCSHSNGHGDCWHKVEQVGETESGLPIYRCSKGHVTKGKS